MRVLIVGLVVLALSVAGISTYLIQRFSTPQAIEELEKKAAPVKYRVLVASRTLRPGDTINNDMVQWADWPEKPASDKYIVIRQDEKEDEKIKELMESRVRQIIAQGEPILTEKLFKSDEPGFMAGQLDRGMRAMAIAVTPQTAVAGFILPGDRVDVLLVHQKAKEAQAKTRKRKAARDEDGTEVKPLKVLTTTTETILQNILVLAIDQAVDSPEGNPVAAKTVTLQLTPKQAEILTTGRSMGVLSLSLRDIASTNEEKTESETYTTDVEVSPFLRGVNQDLKEQGDAAAAQRKQRALSEQRKDEAERQAIEARLKAAEAKIAEQRKAAQQDRSRAVAPKTEPKAVAEPKAKPKPKPKPDDVVIIYRGKSAKSQEIKIK